MQINRTTWCFNSPLNHIVIFYLNIVTDEISISHSIFSHQVYSLSLSWQTLLNNRQCLASLIFSFSIGNMENGEIKIWNMKMSAPSNHLRHRTAWNTPHLFNPNDHKGAQKWIQPWVIRSSHQLLQTKILNIMKTSRIQNGRQGGQKWPTRFFGAPINFCKISFLIQALLLWEK